MRARSGDTMLVRGGTSASVLQEGPDLRSLEEEGDLGVGRVREHVEEAAFDGM